MKLTRAQAMLLDDLDWMSAASTWLTGRRWQSARVLIRLGLAQLDPSYSKIATLPDWPLGNRYVQPTEAGRAYCKAERIAWANRPRCAVKCGDPDCEDCY